MALGKYEKTVDRALEDEERRWRADVDRQTRALRGEFEDYKFGVEAKMRELWEAMRSAGREGSRTSRRSTRGRRGDVEPKYESTVSRGGRRAAPPRALESHSLDAHSTGGARRLFLSASFWR